MGAQSSREEVAIVNSLKECRRSTAYLYNEIVTNRQLDDALLVKEARKTKDSGVMSVVEEAVREKRIIQATLRAGLPETDRHLTLRIPSSPSTSSAVMTSQPS